MVPSSATTSCFAGVLRNYDRRSLISWGHHLFFSFSPLRLGERFLLHLFLGTSTALRAVSLPQPPTPVHIYIWITQAIMS